MSTYRPTFASHSHADNDLCDRYVGALRARGLDIWYDRNNAQAGHFLGDEIQRELERRPAFMLLLTQNALDSFWVQLEMQTYLGLMAQQRTRLLLAVRIGPCAVPPMLNALLWLDALALPFEQAVDQIATALLLGDGERRDNGPAPTPPAYSAATITATTSLPALGPAPAPRDATAALHLTPTSLYTLGFRGYSRAGVEFVLPPLCPVPGGIFTMGSDQAHDKVAQYDESPQYPVEVAGFAIGQHPVTVAEYACAVRATAVREPSAFTYPKDATWVAPAWRGKTLDWAAQLKRSDHPVVMVSWDNVTAYCAWLAQASGQPWRLPSEAQWEKAARWDASGPASQLARLYPWGDAFDKSRCNTDASGIGTTTPVGSYPGGASPCGAQDMAGNVWEWTSSVYKPYPYNATDSRERADSTENRVLRGGSWGYGDVVARAAHRVHPERGHVNVTHGFRLAWLRAGSTL